MPTSLRCIDRSRKSSHIPAEEAIDCSAKMGIGIEEILEAVVHRIPPPAKPKDEILRALVFDSVFDVYRGVVAYVRVMSGKHRRPTSRCE